MLFELELVGLWLWRSREYDSARIRSAVLSRCDDRQKRTFRESLERVVAGDDGRELGRHALAVPVAAKGVVSLACGGTGKINCTH